MKKDAWCTDHQRRHCCTTSLEGIRRAAIPAVDSISPVRPWASQIPEPSVSQGGAATLICYGQTGTGKTHTVAGAMDHLAAALAGRDVAVRLLFLPHPPSSLGSSNAVWFNFWYCVCGC